MRSLFDDFEIFILLSTGIRCSLFLHINIWSNSFWLFPFYFNLTRVKVSITHSHISFFTLLCCSHREWLIIDRDSWLDTTSITRRMADSIYGRSVRVLTKSELMTLSASIYRLIILYYHIWFSSIIIWLMNLSCHSRASFIFLSAIIQWDMCFSIIIIINRFIHLLLNILSNWPFCNICRYLTVSISFLWGWGLIWYILHLLWFKQDFSWLFLDQWSISRCPQLVF